MADITKYPCTKCGTCGNSTHQSSKFPGQKFPSKADCEKAVKAAK